MNDIVREHLARVREYGRAVIDDPRRCEGLLRDVSGENKREINVLVSALRERVPTDLLSSQGTVPAAIRLAQLSRRLQDNQGMSEEAAQWAVVSWAAALGVDLSGAAASSPPASASFGGVGVPRSDPPLASQDTRPIQPPLSWSPPAPADPPTGAAFGSSSAPPTGGWSAGAPAGAAPGSTTPGQFVSGQMASGQTASETTAQWSAATGSTAGSTVFPAAATEQAARAKSQVPYAPFGQRVAAWVVDFVILTVTSMILAAILKDETVYAILSVVVQWLYFAGLESSEAQATFGKRMVGLVVTDMWGRRLTFGHATGRYFAKFVSALILCLGYLFPLFTERKQALHDLIASTLVLEKAKVG